MLTRKPCKYCGSYYHSKAKCPTRVSEPLRAVYKKNSTEVRLSPKNPSERPKLAYKGNSERSQLIGWADKYHSAYIRSLSEYCYTCNARPEELQNGHFINRRYLKVRWNNMNCHPQCNDCNVVKNGNLEVYERKLRSEYGDAAVDELILYANSPGKVTNSDIQAIIDEYKGVVF